MMEGNFITLTYNIPLFICSYFCYSDIISYLLSFISVFFSIIRKSTIIFYWIRAIQLIREIFRHFSEKNTLGSELVYDFEF